MDIPNKEKIVFIQKEKERNLGDTSWKKKRKAT